MWAAPVLRGQCILINEIVINGAGPNDGQNAPNTEEWIELYNSCDTPVNIGCYILTDGDWGVTIPAGTTIGPGAHYTIGSVNAGFPVDLNIATCGCSGGTNPGVLTNGDEQMLLFDAGNSLLDGIIWGDGQLPLNYSQTAYAGCSSQNFSLNNASNLEQLPTGGGQGCAIHRACDGGDEWLQDCDGGTPGTTNSTAASYSIQFPNTPVCIGECVDWSLTDATGVTSIEWTLDGALQSNANTNTATACYDVAGTYDIAVNITSSCGSQVLQASQVIEVIELQLNITASELQSPCPGESPVLSTTSAGTYQWYLNYEPIPGANSSTYQVLEDGEYQLQLSAGSCTTVSETLIIDFIPLPTLTVNIDGANAICPSTEMTLHASPGFSDIQWYEGTTALGNDMDQTISNAGSYFYTATLNGCPLSSDTILIVEEAPLTISITASDVSPCPGINTQLDLIGGLGSIDWLRNNTLFQSTNDTQISVNQGGIYSAQLTTINGCVYNSNEVEIQYLLLDTLQINNPSGSWSMCQDSSIVLQAIGNFNVFEWWNSSGIIATGDSFEAITSGELTVIGYSNGCSVESSPVVISVLPSPNLLLAEEGNVVTCQLPYLVDVSTTGFLIWTFNGMPFVPNNLYALETAGTYTVTAWSEEMCQSATHILELTFVDAPPIVITANDSVACQGEQINLTASGPYQNWTWNDSEVGATRTTSETGNYEVTGISNEGCVQQEQIQITFQPLPELVTTETMESDCVNGALLEAASNGVVSWFDSNGQFLQEGANYQANPSEDSWFEATSTLNGCSATAFSTVLVNCDVLYIPSAFSPNGDGINDVFQVIINGYSTYHLMIFDRWGNPVFDATNAYDVWTGGINTHFVADGVYHYRLEALDSEGNPFYGRSVHSGHVIVLR
jgi:gliding motility-associated-like protein